MSHGEDCTLLAVLPLNCDREPARLYGVRKAPRQQQAQWRGHRIPSLTLYSFTVARGSNMHLPSRTGARSGSPRWLSGARLPARPVKRVNINAPVRRPLFRLGAAPAAHRRVIAHQLDQLGCERPCMLVLDLPLAVAPCPWAMAGFFVPASRSTGAARLL